MKTNLKVDHVHMILPTTRYNYEGQKCLVADEYFCLSSRNKYHIVWAIKAVMMLDEIVDINKFKFILIHGDKKITDYKKSYNNIIFTFGKDKEII